MADDKNKNEDPEEEKKDQFDDDEDFGLPDLDYDELDDEDEVKEEKTETPEVTPTAADEETDQEHESAETEEEIGTDMESEDWEKELEEELEAELKSGELEGFYEEESYEEFNFPEEKSEEVVENKVSEPAASPVSKPAPTVTPNPGRRTQYVQPAKMERKQNYAAAYNKDKEGQSKGKFARTVVIGTLFFSLVAVLFFLLYPGEDKKPVTKVEPKVEKPKPVVEEKKPEPVKEEPKSSKPAANTMPAGQITTLEQQTGKTYIIVGSFFDGDQASDMANKLSKEGKSPMIIPPFKDHRFYRVSIAEFNSFRDAQENLEGYKAEYGADIWPLRY